MTILIVLCWLGWLSFVACFIGFVATGGLVPLIGSIVTGYCTYKLTTAVIEYK